VTASERLQIDIRPEALGFPQGRLGPITRLPGSVGVDLSSVRVADNASEADKIAVSLEFADGVVPQSSGCHQGVGHPSAPEEIPAQGRGIPTDVAVSPRR
jgi:hypothetical protein